MVNFVVRIPYQGEGLHAFKIASDIFAYADHIISTKYSIVGVDDETANVRFPITLGVFRAQFEGQCSIIDRDFDHHVALISFETHDRNGNGKISARIRLSIDEDTSCVICDCDVLRKGMFLRVEIPVISTISEKLFDVVSYRLRELNVDTALAEIQEYSVAGEHDAYHASLPAWLHVLQFPGKIILFPLRVMRWVSLLL